MPDLPTQLAIARTIARVAHRGQTDKAGEPYILHPEAVARTFQGQENADSLQIVAWLHDVLEDTDLTREDLHAAGIDYSFISDVERLTRVSGESAEDYYTRVNGSTRARKVKLADVRHNSDPRRLAVLDSEVQLRLIQKYAKALTALT